MWPISALQSGTVAALPSGGGGEHSKTGCPVAIVVLGHAPVVPVDEQYAVASSCLVCPWERHWGALVFPLVGPWMEMLVSGGWEYTATWLLVNPAALAVIYATPVLLVGRQVV